MDAQALHEPSDQNVISEISVTVTREDKYRFLVDFGPNIAPAVAADEPPPLGGGAGPSPSQLLAAAVANCLSSSLIFAYGRYEDPGKLTTTVVCEVGRNERKRLRIVSMKVTMTLGVAPESLGHLQEDLAQFEDFCTVSQSVRAGIPFTVTVKSPDDSVLK